MIKPKELMGYLSGAVLIVAAIGCAGGGSNPGDVVGDRGPGAGLLPDTLRKPHPSRKGS